MSVIIHIWPDVHSLQVNSVFAYFGSSEGGREALTMAQRFPSDYDGIVGGAAVISWTGLMHAYLRNQSPQLTDWFDAAKAPLLSKHVSDACDALDGLADGVINNYLACPARVNLQPLRCPGGADTGATCLSDTEISTVAAIHSPYTLPFAVANGVTTYPQWLYGHEDSLDGPTVQNMVCRITGTAAPAVPPNAATNSQQWLLADNWIRFGIVRNRAFDPRTYNPNNYVARVQQTSELMDSTNPDLSAFFARGGKLIMREYAADLAKSPLTGVNYYNAVVARLGQAAVDQSLKFYISPASTHTGNSRSVTDQSAVPTMVNLLDPLDAWVTTGQMPPDAITQTLKSAVPPFATQASRPMCRYPNYPRFNGGDRRQASSYSCVASDR